MSAIDTILKYAERYEHSIHRGKCSVDKLFMMDRCIGGNMLLVKLPGVEDELIEQSTVVHLLKLEVQVLAAVPEYSRPTWGWEPEEYARGKVIFYHHDYEQLLPLTAEWLELHKDPIAPDYIEVRCKDNYNLHPLKCDPIGRIKHYTNQPGFEEGNLKRKGY